MEETKSIHEVSISSIDESNPLVGYTDGDVVILDNVRQMNELRPLKAKMNFIIICQQGRMQLDVNGDRRMLNKNDVLFSCADVILDNYMMSPDFECKILCLSERIIYEMLREHVKVWNRAVYVVRANIVSLSDEYVQQYALYYALVRQNMLMPDRHFAKYAMQSLIQALLFDLSSILYEHDAEGTKNRQTQGKLLFDRFLTMISHEKVKRRPVGYYAGQLAVTPKYLTTVCEHYGGKPAKEWINQYVQEDVRYHLRNTPMPIKEVADRLGFTNVSHFGTYVRRHFGVSPSVYRSNE